MKLRPSSLFLGLAFLICGCTEVTQIGTSVGVASGTITQGQAQSIKRSAAAVEKTFQDITPEQEYYIGRSVAATILTTYKPFDQEAATRYVNLIGQTLGQASGRPETFGGYHFAIMDTDEINAFAAPGGLILISRGLLRCCRNEDALAAVLAHEVSHVERQHGLKAIKAGRLTNAALVVGTEVAKNLTTQELAEATKAFEGTINDIFSTLVNSGYSRSTEFEADATAVNTLRRVGYNPEGLVDMLQEMQKRLKPGSHGFGSTHPAPKDRIDAVRKILGKPVSIVDQPVRKQRFAAALSKI
jgi:beta-barrel assembly-enhancing protease